MSDPHSPPPDTNEDCVALHRALEDIRCDTQAVIKVVSRRNQQQRSRIRRFYSTKYEQDLIQRLKSKLGGHFEDAVVHWMSDPAERYAVFIHDSFKGLWKYETAAVEALYPQTPSQIAEIRHAYYSMFHRSLEEDIGLKTSGDYKMLLLGFLREERADVSEPDVSVAEADAKELVSAFANRNSVDKNKIIRVLSTRSPLQLRATIDYYSQAFGHSIGKVIKQTPQGSFRTSLSVTMKIAKNPVNYFAKALYRSMKGLGTDDSTLIRIIVTRADIDMISIMTHFSRKYRKSLPEMIASDTSGDYKQFLLLIIGTPANEIRHLSSRSSLIKW